MNRAQENEVEQLHKNLFVHKPSFSKFLKLMAKAKGLVTTAGFESVCEAIYFGKPVLMVPVPNHFEQSCNAYDAERFGAGLAQDNFDLDNFLSFTKSGYESPKIEFHNWLNKGKGILLSQLSSLEVTMS